MIRCNRRQIVHAGLLVSLAGFRADAARCQPRYPERPIRVIVPFAAGGVGEAAIRVLAPGMEQKLGQRLVVEPKPGGAGNLGAREVARADADGYTILVAAAGNFVINQFLTKMPFDPLAALTPIAKIAEIPIVFCSNPSMPVQSLAEFVAYARAHRGKFNYGSPGNGSVNHLVVENSSISPVSRSRIFRIAARRPQRWRLSPTRFSCMRSAWRRSRAISRMAS